MPPVPPNKAVNKNANRPLPKPPGNSGAAPIGGRAASNNGNKPAAPSKGRPQTAGSRGPGPAGANAIGPGAATGKDKKAAALNGATATKNNANTKVAGGTGGGASASSGSASASGKAGSAATQKTTGGSLSAGLKPTPPTSKIPSSNANRPLPTPPQPKGPVNAPGKGPKANKPAKQESESKGNQTQEPSNFDPRKANDPAFKQWQKAAKHAEKNAGKYAINPSKK